MSTGTGIPVDLDLDQTLTASLPCSPTLLLQEVRFRRELSLLAVSIHGFHLALTDSRQQDPSSLAALRPLSSMEVRRHPSVSSQDRDSGRDFLWAVLSTPSQSVAMAVMTYCIQIQIPSCVYSYTIPRALHVAKLTLLLQEVRLLSLLSFRSYATTADSLSSLSTHSPASGSAVPA